MQKAKAFFYVCAGMFLLALSYHFGASTAIAQGPGNPVICETNGAIVLANGDVYTIPSVGNSLSTWSLTGNIFSGAPTPATHESWGTVKQRFR